MLDTVLAPGPAVAPGFLGSNTLPVSAFDVSTLLEFLLVVDVYCGPTPKMSLVLPPGGCITLKQCNYVHNIAEWNITVRQDLMASTQRNN